MRQTWVELRERPRGLRNELDGTIHGLVGTGVHGLIGRPELELWVQFYIFRARVRNMQFNFLKPVFSREGWSGDRHRFSKDV